MKTLGFLTNEVRVTERVALDQMIELVFSGLKKPELEVRMEKASIAFGWLNSVSDLSMHPQLRRVSVKGELGEIRQVASPIQIQNIEGGDSVRLMGRRSISGRA